MGHKFDQVWCHVIGGFQLVEHGGGRDVVGAGFWGSAGQLHYAFGVDVGRGEVSRLFLGFDELGEIFWGLWSFVSSVTLVRAVGKHLGG